jgi:hypothetical protein
MKIKILALIQAGVVLAASANRNGNGHGDGSRPRVKKRDNSNEERDNSNEERDKSNEERDKSNDDNSREKVAFTVSSETIHSTLPPVQQPPVAQSQDVQPPAAPPPVQQLEETKPPKDSVDNLVPFTKAQDGVKNGPQNGVKNGIQNGVKNGLPAASVGNQSSQNDDPSSNATIGIVVGSILGILALVFGILIVKRHKSRKTLSVSSDSTIDIDSNPIADFLRKLDRSPSPKNQLSGELVRKSCFSSVLYDPRSSLNSEIYDRRSSLKSEIYDRRSSLKSEIYLELDE